MADYGTRDNVKLLLNINTGATEVDSHIDRYLEEADEFIKTRVKLMDTSSSTGIITDEELDALGEGLAASLYNYWTSPSKSMEGVKHYKEMIVNHLRAAYSNTMEQDTTQNTFSKTASRITGTS